MRIILLLLACSGFLVAANDQERAIRTLVQDYVKARNDKNAPGTRSLFTDDADQLVSTGVWRRGVDALVKGAMASSGKELNQSSIIVEDIRFVSPEVAIVDGRYQTTDANSRSPRKMWTTLVVKRTAAGWRIAAIRNMLPASSGPSH
ncbi:MAG TPA: SgcJ/EcaC family oxidoreductase [Bryobacteraceae bacterium]|nr:SgcJ/EcaC family oxidoreductase [Bryobacteraceae bacterium]